MKALRQLCWEDVQVSRRDWTDSRGRVRTHVSLKGFAQVNHTFWIKEWTDHPEQRAMVLLELTRKANALLRRLAAYLKDE